MPPKRKAEDDDGDEPASASEPSPKKKSANGAGPTTGVKAKQAGAESIERSPTPRAAGPAALTLVHWNVGGLNGLLNNPERKARLLALVEAEAPDLLAISEHKLSEDKITAMAQGLLVSLPGYKAHWAVSTAKKGYSGVAVLVKKGVAVHSVELDKVGALNEGRTTTLELDSCFAVAAYVPNSGQKLERLDYRIDTWDPALREYVRELEKRKPVVLFGDLNVCHLDADIWNHDAKHIPKSAGCTPRERASFSTLLGDEYNFVDCFRQLHPDVSGVFSYWSTRAGNQLLNRGLRLDYAVTSAALVSGDAPLKLHSCDMLQEYAPNGDHAPLLVAFEAKA